MPWPSRLTDLGIPADNGRDVVKHVRDGRPEAMRLVRQAGRELGGVLASAVNFFNPGVIVIGGDIAHADEHLLAGVREVVYRRSTALATRSIRIARSTLDDRAGILGAAVMVTEAVLSPDAVDQQIASEARASRGTNFGWVGRWGAAGWIVTLSAQVDKGAGPGRAGRSRSLNAAVDVRRAYRSGRSGYTSSIVASAS